MIKFENLLASACATDFKFVNQRIVRLVCLSGSRVVSYGLTKSDVILAINKYLADIHHFSDNPVRGEGMNFYAFKMHDLVPYLYTLINLYISVSTTSYDYHRFLPELKITRFCHMPFEDEVIVPAEMPKIEIECAYLHAEGSKSFQYVALLAAFHPIAYDSIDELRDKLQSLFPLKCVVLRVVGS